MAAYCAAVSLAHANQLPLPRLSERFWQRVRCMLRSAIASTGLCFKSAPPYGTYRSGKTSRFIPRLHDESNIKQAWSKMKQTHLKYTCTTCALNLFHVGVMSASSCKQGITLRFFVFISFFRKQNIHSQLM